jgi:hypothetical protein
MLGHLQDNGGPAFTHELLAGSPAVDAGDPAFTPPPDYDQRGPGFDRVVNDRIDIGSFEVQPTSDAHTYSNDGAEPNTHTDSNPNTGVCCAGTTTDQC